MYRTYGTPFGGVSLPPKLKLGATISVMSNDIVFGGSFFENNTTQNR